MGCRNGFSILSIMVKSKFGSDFRFWSKIRSKIKKNSEKLDSFRNGLFDLEDVGLILTGIFFARNVGKKFFLSFCYPQNAKIKIWGATFWPPNGAWLYSEEAKNDKESFSPWKNFDPSHRIRRKNKKRFCKKLSGPLPAKPLKLDRHGLAYLKRNKITIIFLFRTNFNPVDRYLRKSKKRFCKKNSGPLAARPVNIDPNKLHYLKRNKISIIFYSRVNFDPIDRLGTQK